MTRVSLRHADYYWFEALDMYRKFLLVAGLALLKPGSVTQLMAAQIVCFVYVITVVNYAPYRKDDADFANQAGGDFARACIGAHAVDPAGPIPT